MATQSVDPKSVVVEWIKEAAIIGHSDVYDAKRTNKRFEWHQQMELLVDGETQYVSCRDIGTGGWNQHPYPFERTQHSDDPT
ncbi:MAG: hypothetical protein R3E58_20905 [Phycisphaerae bacterium]